MFAPSAVLHHRTQTSYKVQQAPTLLLRAQTAIWSERSGQALGGTGEEPEMIPLLIAIAIVCVAFWRVALKILAIVAVFLLVSGIVLIIQDLHHIK